MSCRGATHTHIKCTHFHTTHYDDIIMSAIASQITSLTIVYSIIYSDADQRKHQSSASLAFVWGIHRGPVNSPHKGPVTRKMFPFDDVIMNGCEYLQVLTPVVAPCEWRETRHDPGPTATGRGSFMHLLNEDKCAVIFCLCLYYICVCIPMLKMVQFNPSMNK